MTMLERPMIDASSGASTARTRWRRLDRLLEAAGDRLNPILVKETRQALKSRQFSITFTLVLACAWVWSMLGVALIGPGVYYGAEGHAMFSGYYIVLAFPLLVIVPFGAFRSLAGEREDGTYELLCVTTLKPRQLVSGKLGSAVLQMLVYFSAVAPCLAFTYMLRGIDFPTILFVMFYTFLGSLGLSLAGLVIATVTQEKHWQVVLSVFLVFGLGLAFWLACALVVDALGYSAPDFQEADFWVVNAALLTAYASYFALLFCAASAQLTFASDNRSTPLRIVMLAQQLLFTGWMGWTFVAYVAVVPLLVFLMLSGIHWYAMGAFMNGESGELSQRVKRRLPQSFLGRAFLTWFNPGPATGYLFAVTNLLAVGVLGLFGLLWHAVMAPATSRGWSPADIENSRVIAFVVLGFCYVTLYLGLGRLLIDLIRRFTQASMLLCVLVQVLLLLAGCGIPLTIHLMIPGLRDDYALIEMSNPLWTLYEVIESGLGSLGTAPATAADALVLFTAVPLAALLVFLLNLPRVVAAVRHVRIAKPRRVAEEDALLEAQHALPVQAVNPLE